MSNLTIYPLVDDNGVEWRFESLRPISRIADKVMNTIPEPCDEDELKRIETLLESGLFPDLKIKTHH